MKKLLSLMLALSMTCASFTVASAREGNPMQELPNSEIFEKEGTEYTKKAYQEWLDKALPEVLVDKLLTNNYAFVADSANYWKLTSKAKMSKPAVFENGVMKIPSDTAKEIFNVSSGDSYVSVETIIEKNTAWKQFTDPRGFTLIAKDLSVIDKKPAIEGNPGGRHYRSYYDVSLAIGEITWEDINPTDEDFAYMRKRWVDALTLKEGLTDEAYVQNEIKATKELMELFNPAGIAPIFTDDRNVYAQYQALYQMSRGYKLLKDLGRNDLDLDKLKNYTLTLFKFLYDTSFGQNIKVDSNWFMNRISYPSFCATALVCMYDDMPYSDIEKYVNALFVRTGCNVVATYCVPWEYYTNGETTDPTNAYSNYTNLIWQTYVNLQLAVLVNDTYRANHMLRYCNQAFENVTNSGESNVGMLKDGVYEDGSFVFHAWYAYNLGYGKSYAVMIADLAEWTYGTPFDIKRVYGFSNVYDWMERSWLPFINGSWLTKIVQGRESPSNTGAKANSILSAMMILALTSDDEDIMADTAAIIKPMISENIDEYKNITSRLPNYMSLTYPYIEDRIKEFVEYVEFLPEIETKEYSNVYYNMDKVVHRKKDFTFMLSMASDRIDRYEAINNEGYTDWYISDGMTYTMTDSEQYVGNWWNWVDRYKIPGTTADENYRNPTYSQYGTVMPNNSWAGAASNGRFTVASQQLTGNANGRTARLDAYKSYFMLDDKIVCIGTGISGGEGEVFTTVENQLLSKEAVTQNLKNGYPTGYEEIIIDGNSAAIDFDREESFTNPKYAWIEPGRGFIFFGDNNVKAERVADDKAYIGLNKESAAPNRQYPFMTLGISHGENPENAGYAYAILPGKTFEETQECAENPKVEILSQTSAMHAVKDTESGVVMAAIMEPSELLGFKFVTPCCVVLDPQENGGYIVHVSEPTQKLRTVKITLPEEKEVTSDFVHSLNGRNLELDVDVAYGKTYSFSYDTKESQKTENSKNIDVSNIKINYGEGIISTKLNAANKGVGDLTFKIAEQPENGQAIIRDGRLYFIPDIYTANFVNQIVIEVTNEQGDVSSYTVTVRK